MRWLIRQCVKAGRVAAFNQYNKSEIFDDFLEIISKELGVRGNKYVIIEVCLKF